MLYELMVQRNNGIIYLLPILSFPDVDRWKSGSACGAKRLNLPHCERDRESDIKFSFVGMCDALMQMFDLRQIYTSLRIRFITLSDLDVDWLITDILSI